MLPYIKYLVKMKTHVVIFINSNSATYENIHFYLPVSSPAKLNNWLPLHRVLSLPGLKVKCHAGTFLPRNKLGLWLVDASQAPERYSWWPGGAREFWLLIGQSEPWRPRTCLTCIDQSELEFTLNCKKNYVKNIIVQLSSDCQGVHFLALLWSNVYIYAQCF